MPGDRLHGYETFRTEFLPGLVGRDAEGNRTQLTHPAGAPIVRILGGRGTGKTALCGGLYTDYARVGIPVARWPLAPGQHRLPPSEGTEVRDSPAVGVLNWLVVDLEAGGVRFPRFTYGLLAAATLADPVDGGAGGDGGGGGGAAHRDAQAFRAALTALETALAQAAPGNQLMVLFAAVIETAAAIAPAFAPGLPNLDELAQRFTARYLGRRPKGQALRWWETELDELPGPGARRLLMYARNLGVQGLAGARGNLEKRLTRAFLADIDAHYGGLQWFPSPRPLILLDDIHSGVGPRLFDLLRSAYVRMGGPGNETGTDVRRPVIVATELSATELSATDRRAGPAHRAPVPVSTVDKSLWSTPAGEGPPIWELWLRAPVLHTENITAELDVQDCPRGLPDLIGRLSAGRAGSARILLLAARRDLQQGRNSALRRCSASRLGEVLLDLPATEEEDVPVGDRPQLRETLFGLPPAERGPTACDAVLWHLVPDPQLLAWLPRRAAALSQSDVPHLPLPPVPAADQNWAENPQRVRELLHDGPWERRPWRGTDGFVPTVADRVLRELLLHQLRAESAPTAEDDHRAGPAADAALTYWRRLHEAARNRYTRGFLAEDRSARARYLHHCLALGLQREVVAELHRALADRDGRAWLSAVQFVCAAPCPPAGYTTHNPEPNSSCLACEGAPPHTTHSEINRLVTMVWGASRLSSSYEEPDNRYNPLRELLYSLGGVFDDEGHEDDTLRRAAARWPTLLCNGRRAPDLPISPEDD
jgi:hypothetical protein